MCARKPLCPGRLPRHHAANGLAALRGCPCARVPLRVRAPPAAVSRRLARPARRHCGSPSRVHAWASARGRVHAWGECTRACARLQEFRASLSSDRPAVHRETQCAKAGTECCAQCYTEFEDLTCEQIKADTSADDHYCRYVDWPEYRRVQTGGVVTAILLAAIMAATVLFRDIMKVWTCGGLTDAPLPVPDRQLTTMSAAYAAETMPGSVKPPAPTFQQTSAPMGMAPMGMAPMQPPMMPMGMGGYPGQPMGMGGMPMMMR